MEEQLERQLVYLGRYGRQSRGEVEKWPVPRVDHWTELISECIKAENPTVTHKAEQEWL